MKRLGDYKKAEKGAKILCMEYESMKVKYFNCLTENEKQKQTISDYIQSQSSKNEELSQLR
jgi:hypothetical protein